MPGEVVIEIRGATRPILKRGAGRSKFSAALVRHRDADPKIRGRGRKSASQNSRYAQNNARPASLGESRRGGGWRRESSLRFIRHGPGERTTISPSIPVSPISRSAAETPSRETRHRIEVEADRSRTGAQLSSRSTTSMYPAR